MLKSAFTTERRQAFVLVAVFSAIFVGILCWRFVMGPRFVAEAVLLLVESPADEKKGKGTAPEDRIPEQIRLVTSAAILDRALLRLDRANRVVFAEAADPLTALTDAVSASPGMRNAPGTENSMITLSCRGRNADDCRAVLHAVIDSYQEFVAARWKRVNDPTIELIAKARNLLLKDHAQAEARYHKQRTESPVVWRDTTILQDRLAKVDALRQAQEIELLKAELAADHFEKNRTNALSALAAHQWATKIQFHSFPESLRKETDIVAAYLSQLRDTVERVREEKHRLDQVVKRQEAELVEAEHSRLAEEKLKSETDRLANFVQIVADQLRQVRDGPAFSVRVIVAPRIR